MKKWIPILVITIIAIILISIFPRWTVDDAYIYFRYAENLANHGDISWNIGETPVEGYTGIFWLVLLAGAIKLGISPIITTHVLGIIGFALGAIGLWTIFKQIKINYFGQYAALLLYTTTPLLYTHIFSGLETTIFLGLILASMAVAINAIIKKNIPTTISLFIVLLLTGLTRPEGVAFAGILGLILLIFIYKQKKSYLKQYIILGILFYIIPASLYMIWRINLYGYIFPNTYYAKELSGFQVSNITDMGRFFISYFAAPTVLGIFLLLPSLDSVFKKLKEKNLSRIIIIVTTLSLFSIAEIFQLSRSHLIVNYAYRLYMPILPLFWVLFGISVGVGFDAHKIYKKEEPLRYKASLLFIMLLATYQLAFHTQKFRKEVKFVIEEELILQAEHVSVGKFLNKELPQEEWLVSYIDAGAIPYYAKHKTLDFGNLNDSALAHEKKTELERIDYLFDKKPGAIVMTSIDKEIQNYGRESEAIISDKRFINYILVKKFISPIEKIKYHEFVYFRNDLLKNKQEEDQNDIVEEFEENIVTR